MRNLISLFLIFMTLTMTLAYATKPLFAANEKIVVLDPGHTNPDKFGEEKSDENELNVKTARALEALLKNNGYTVYLTRSQGEGGNGYYEDLQGRVDFANSKNPNAFVSIHFDHTTQGLDKSVKAFYRKPNDSRSQQLGSKISSALSQRIGYSLLPPEAGDYYVLNTPGAATDCQGGKVKGYPNVACTITTVQRSLNAPGIIMEIFPGNVPYATLNNSVNEIAAGYCDGIAQFLDNKNCNASAPSSATTTPGASSGTGTLQVTESNEVVTRVGNPPQSLLTSGVRPTAPAAPGDLKQAIQEKFGVTMNGYGQQHLLWVWQKLWDVSNTRFPEYVRGSVVNATTGGSYQANCKTVYLTAYPTEELFKVVFVHELGHIIRWCTGAGESFVGELPEVIVKDTYLTNYSVNARVCTGSDNFNEDYAEMITYYLNPSAASQTARCSGFTPNPYANGNHVLHFNLAKKILGVY